MAKARIEGELTLRDQKFNATLDKAEQRGRTFGQRFQRFVGVESFQGERRVSRATGILTSGLLQAQSAADLATAGVIAFERSLKIGFGGAVALAGGIALFEKFKGSIAESDKAYKDLQANLNRPLGLQSKLSPEGIGGEIDQLQSSSDKAFDQATGFANKLRSGAANVMDFIASAATRGSAAPSRGDKVDDALINPIEQAQKKLDELAKARGRAELAVANAHQLSADGMEREAALAETAAKFEEKRAAIRLGPLDAGTSDRLKAANKEQSIAESIIRKKMDAKARELDLAEEVADIEAGGHFTGGGGFESYQGRGPTTPQQRKILALRAEIAANQAAMQSATPDEQQMLRTRGTGLQSALNDAQYDYAQTPWSQVRAGEREAQKRQQFAGAMNKPDTLDKWGVHQGAYGFTSTKPTVSSEEDTVSVGKPLTKEDLKDVMKEYWEGDGGGGGSTGAGG